MRKMILVLMGFWHFSPPGLAVSPQDVRLDHALMVGLEQAGFDILSREIYDRHLAGFSDMDLPDSDSAGPVGTRITTEGGRLQATVQEFHIVPVNGGLTATGAFSHLAVFLSKARAQRKVLGANVSSTCRNTTVELGGSEPVRFTLDIGLSVRDGYIQLESRGFQMPVDRDNFEVDGPASCSGELGVGWLTRQVVHLILEQMYASVDDQIGDRLRDTVPSLADQLNDSLRRSMEFDLPGSVLAPRGRLIADLQPGAVRAEPGQLEVTMDLHVRPGADGTPKSSIVPENGGIGGLERQVGRVGVDPRILTEILGAMFPDGMDWVELTPDLVPGIEEVLNIQSASSIWPDLTTFTPTDRRLRLYVRMGAMPTFSADEHGQVVEVRMPAIQMMFWVQREGAWNPYFLMSLDIGMAAQPRYLAGRVQLVLPRRIALGITGNWADSYMPNLDIFEQDMAMILFGGIFDYLQASGPVFSIEPPAMVIGGRDLRVASAGIRDEYVTLGLATGDY